MTAMLVNWCVFHVGAAIKIDLFLYMFEPSGYKYTYIRPHIRTANLLLPWYTMFSNNCLSSATLFPS